MYDACHCRTGTHERNREHGEHNIKDKVTGTLGDPYRHSS